jgi:hypothetical protein
MKFPVTKHTLTRLLIMGADCELKYEGSEFWCGFCSAVTDSPKTSTPRVEHNRMMG